MVIFIICCELIVLKIFQFQECQSLMEENRRLHLNMNYSAANIKQDEISLTNASTVEEVVLQTQIDALQWQLNQVNFENFQYFFYKNVD